MASNPPFQMEDQSDEDFFDKLVDDDEGLLKPNREEGNDSDDANAFSNPSIGNTDVPVNTNPDGGKSGVEAKSEKDHVDLDSAGVIDAQTEERNSLMASSSVGPESNDVMGSQLPLDSKASQSNGLTNSGVKEVGWNSFHADAKEKGDLGGGSCSDFFSELGGDSGDFPGQACDDLSSGVKSGNEVQSDGVRSSANYMQYQQGQGYETSAVGSTNGNDMNSSQYWENIYPGWRYDSSTGQWYQIDDYNAIANAQGSSGGNSTSDWNASADRKADASYMQQNSHCVSGTVTQTATAGSVSEWSQVSQRNNGYPDHMVFEPHYPGWYYDTIAQEWRSLETYNLSVQTALHGHENGYFSAGTASQNNNTVYGEFGQANNYETQNLSSQGQSGCLDSSYSNKDQQHSNTYQTEIDNKIDAARIFSGNQQFNNLYGSETSVNKVQENVSNSFGGIPLLNKASESPSKGIVNLRSFVPGGNTGQRFNFSNVNVADQEQFSNDYSANQKHTSYSQQSFQGGQHFSYAQTNRSSAGHLQHALVTFAFGGKLIVMKGSISMNSSYGSQGPAQGSVSVLNLMEVVSANVDASGSGTCDYFHALLQQSFPGPLVGGSVGNKELNKWIDERIANCESPDMDYKKSERLRLLLSLIKIACQHYGKLRSPFGADTILKENDTPELAVAKLFTSAKRSGAPYTDYGAVSHCLQNVPSQGQIRATAYEVQNLLVSGRKKEALQCAQDGQLWGPALVLASKLGDQFYVDTVKQMALRQLVAGSPLRTLCLLIAGQPAEVFALDTSTSGLSASVPQQHAQFGANCMLDDWEENLAMITANRTKDDELVIIHLGDCLWKERSEITAAHICYLVAEANFEPYSDSARLCLVGADHWKFPRTYASPGAIQRTELYEYSKVLGNSQFILLPFQPYKLIYAHMLAEVGKISDSLRYCQAILKSLKTGRAPEVEAWKQVVLSLEERIRTHQQGGYTANLAPAKLVGKLLNFFDSTAHRVVGGLPPTAPTTQGNAQGNEQYHQPMGPRVSNSQSTMAMSSLIPSASMEPISDWTADNRITKPNRSVSEPDFGRSPRQGTTSTGAQDKAAVSAGVSRFSRFGFGSQLFQKTVGLVLRPRPGRQAKLGEKNKFYYDEKLKRWVEEGAESPAEEASLPPPPPTAAFQNGTPAYNLKPAFKTEGSPYKESPDLKASIPSDQNSGIPPIPPASNQFFARGRMGVRSRYVDTFNQGGGNPANLFQSPSIPSVKPAFAANAKFFIPTPAASNEQIMEAIAENAQGDNAASEIPSTSSINNPFQPPKPSFSPAMQRFPSMSNIMIKGTVTNSGSSLPPHSRRTVSWSGSFGDVLSPPNVAEFKPLGEALGKPPPYMPNEPPKHMPVRGGNFGEDLHEVEL